jgi:two-component system OmpR family sensor kinase
VSRIVGAIGRRLTRLPIRWRLAVTSAGLTFLILALFAIVVGTFTGRQVREDFDNDLRTTVADLRARMRIETTFTETKLNVSPEALAAAGAGKAAVRIVGADGQALYPRPPSTGPDLGSPISTLHNFGGWRVASAPIYGADLLRPAAYVQYAKPRAAVKHTLARLRLFLTAGVFGGALAALFAGLAVARRAMNPITRLTRAAREIARTRDAAVTLPKPEANDEVTALARTLDDMLRELDAARTELEAMLERQREFVADASHELRTPLTSILANLELLEAALDGEDAEMVQSALRSSRRMRGLVSDLLLLARADAQRERTREPVDVGDVVLAAAGEAAPLAEDHVLSVDVPGPVVVDGWRDDLHRLVLNLIENALRHTPPGTHVRVATHDVGNQVELVVEDDGPGLPAQIRERAFERFVRGAGDGGRGSGLGLAIVNAVAAAHGGTVDYADRESGGARFRVRLPAYVGVTPRRRPAGSSAGA